MIEQLDASLASYNDIIACDLGRDERDNRATTMVLFLRSRLRQSMEIAR